MNLFRGLVMILLLTPIASVSVSAQAFGSLELAARPKIAGKSERVKRKRFYLFSGGLEANRALIDRINAANATSRDCFYCQMKASQEYIAWLKAEDCESPYCRAITDADVAKVPEFQAAFKKGMAPKAFNGKAPIALKWLTTNLAPELRDGFYRQRKTLVQTILGGTKPIQAAMTDGLNSSIALFVDIPLKKVEPGGKATETFLYTNLVPIELSGKSYVWACEVEIGSAKKATYSLKVPENNKPVSKCEVLVRDLPVCTAGTCSK